MKDAIYTYLKNCPPALELFTQLEDAGSVYLIGGVLREYRDHNAIQSLRDIDIIVDVANRDRWEEILDVYTFQRNRFGGYKLRCSGLLVDTWRIEDTWAFHNQVVVCRPQEYLQYLPKTVFLNIDAILYDWKREIWFDEGYQKAMRTGVLDVVLAENPQLLLNTVRALILQQRYNMVFSDALQQMISGELRKYESLLQFVDRLYSEQLRRYQKEILPKELIAQIIQDLCRIK